MISKTNIKPLIVATMAALAILAGGCSSADPGGSPPEPTNNLETADANTESGEHDESMGRTLFVSKGCAACHGENAEGSSIAPALPGHNEEMVKKQVRNPRFQMPAFAVSQISDEELAEIAGYVSGLEGQEHLHMESSDLTAAVEMHHWMALESLKVDDPEETAHHVSHIVELLGPGDHKTTMQNILSELEKGGDTHGPEHDIEEMLAGSGSPELTLIQLHLKQALNALDAGDLSDTEHHVAHARDTGDDSTSASLAEVLKLLEMENNHGAEHEIQELLGAEDHID